jgi:hypothetical protein
VCAACHARETECEYLTANIDESRSNALKRKIEHVSQKVKDYTDVFNRLKTLPEEEAIGLLYELRSTPDLDSTLAVMNASPSITRRPSDHTTAHAILPLTSPGLESELNMRHQRVYPTLFAIDIVNVGLSPLLDPSARPFLPLNNETLQTGKPPHGEADLLLYHACGLTKLNPLDSLVDQSPYPLRDLRERPVSLVSGAARPQMLCDDRLNHLKMEFWTSVPLSDEFAASVISHYLETDHRIISFFDADLFLTDLVNHTIRCCSPLLVSCLMAQACVRQSIMDHVPG